ncbi:hypothetical protein QJS66_12395 [Kocuria rhizophila]|nr:hypothetical protein QJS66_12395 [Kocuria rhizophila]
MAATHSARFPRGAHPDHAQQPVGALQGGDAVPTAVPAWPTAQRTTRAPGL